MHFCYCLFILLNWKIKWYLIVHDISQKILELVIIKQVLLIFISCIVVLALFTSYSECLLKANDNAQIIDSVLGSRVILSIFRLFRSLSKLSNFKLIKSLFNLCFMKQRVGHQKINGLIQMIFDVCFC